MACCPFHTERKPSWGISINPPHLHACFACGAKGSLIDLLMRVGNMSRDRARQLAESPIEDLRLDELEKIKRPEPKINPHVLYPFQLTKRAVQALRKRGVLYEVILRAGILYDHTDNRVLFPWRIGKRLVGVTGRTLSKDPDVPKTLPMFGTQKGLSLYLPTGRIRAKPFVIVEGEIDALKIVSAGVANVGAICFGRFTGTQKNLVLNSAATEVIVAFDDDTTGHALAKDAIEFFQGKKPVHRVDYVPYRDLYDDKVDPGELTRLHLKDMFKRLSKHADWPSF